MRGCSTGERWHTAWASGDDRSADHVAAARTRVDDPRARFARSDATVLPDPSHSCDAAVSGLVLNFVPEPARAVAEMRRAVRPGGTVAAYVWDYAGQMQLIRAFWDAAVELDPSAAALDEGRRFGVSGPEPLRDLFQSAHLRGVRVRAMDVPTPFADFDDDWQPFLGGQGPAPGYAASLDEPRRAALRELLRGRLPFARDGSIPLARAGPGRSRDRLITLRMEVLRCSIP